MGNGAHGQWGTWAMGYRGMGPMDNRTHGQWGTGVWETWAMRYRGMDHMGNGIQGYGVHGQWGTVGNWIQGLGAHGQWGTGQVMCQNVKKMSNVKNIKHLDYGGGSQQKEIDTLRFTHIDVNFDITYDGH